MRLVNPAKICLPKVNNRNTRKGCKICSKLTIKRQERCQWPLIYQTLRYKFDFQEKNGSVKLYTVWKESVFGAILIRIFPHLDMERYWKCGKIWTRKTPNTDIFHAMVVFRILITKKFWQWKMINDMTASVTWHGAYKHPKFCK